MTGQRSTNVDRIDDANIKNAFRSIDSRMTLSFIENTNLKKKLKKLKKKNKKSHKKMKKEIKSLTETVKKLRRDAPGGKRK
jgi:cell division protein ZapA (FtsZ GTPase activity inhibitor)